MCLREPDEPEETTVGPGSLRRQERSGEERMLGAMSGMDTALLGRKDFTGPGQGC